MSGQTNETQWYIARDGKQHGPLTEIEMRTFVAHNYLRTSDLIWRPGLPEWQPAPEVFPTAFQTQQTPQVAAAAAAAARAASRSGKDQQPAQATDFEQQSGQRAQGSRGKRLAIAAVAAVALAGGALALATYREPLMDMVGSSAPPSPSDAIDAPTVEAPPPITAETTSPTAAPADAQSAAAPATPPITVTPETPPAAQPASVDTPSSAASNMPAPSALGGPDPAVPVATPTDGAAPASATPPSPAPTTMPEATVAALDPAGQAAVTAPPTIDGSPLDAKLQKIPVWALIKKEYPDWYATHITTANKLSSENKPESEIALHLAQGLVALRRQHAEQALAASPEKLQQVAVAFLDHLKTLRSQSVSACYGFISKGEVSPAVVQMLEKPETASGLNSQAGAIFEAAIEGAKTPTKHDAAVKTDYDILIKELSKLGWKDEDLKVFSDPKLLAKREPDQVCKMVQEWFIAHLAVPNKTVRQRLLFETLKPVVSG